MPTKQDPLEPVQGSPGEPGTWWRDNRHGRTVMRRVPLPGEQSTHEAGNPLSSPETRVGA
jgi:hypothetical protein